MTEDLTRMYPSNSGLVITFIDGHGIVGCPPCIENHTQALESTTAVLPRAVDYINSHVVDGVLVCCFSDHPLVYALRDLFDLPIIGIFQAALEEATEAGGRFGIVTTVHAWEDPLTDSINHLGFGEYSAGIAATGLGVLELESLERGVVVERICSFSKRLIDNGAKSIILGCAGMTPLERDIRAGLPTTITTIDGVRSGISILTRLAGKKDALDAATCTDDAKNTCTIEKTKLTSKVGKVF
ncbi:hypothetical protein EsH8_VI_000861 [Colletotrichum jinshuiense]